MGGIKILTGGQHACQEAAWQRKLRAKCDSAAIRAGISPAWDLLPRLLSRKGRAGPEQGHSCRMGWQGHGDGDELKLGWGGGQGQEWSGRLRDTSPSSGKTKGKSCSFKPDQGEDREDLTSFSHMHTALLHGCMAAWLQQAGPQPTISLQVGGWMREDLHTGRFWNVMLLLPGVLIIQSSAIR